MVQVTKTEADLQSKGLRLEELKALQKVHCNGHEYTYYKYPDKRTAGRIAAAVGLTLMTVGLYGLYALVASCTKNLSSLYSKREVKDWVSHDALNELGEQIPSYEELEKRVSEKNEFIKSLRVVDLTGSESVHNIDALVRESKFAQDDEVLEVAYAKRQEAINVILTEKNLPAKRLNDEHTDWLCDDFLPKNKNTLRFYKLRLEAFQENFSDENWRKIEGKIAELEVAKK